jgi:tetratricopeptide (TPR) repeat protein
VTAAAIAPGVFFGYDGPAMAHLSAALRTLTLGVCILAARTALSADCGPTPYDCAVAQVTRQDFLAAIASLGEVLRASPRELKALNLLGIALTGAGRIDEANRRFQQALSIDAAFYPALKNLAVNEFTVRQYAQSQRHFEQVLTRAPADEVAHVHVAEIHYQKKQLAIALEHYERAGPRVGQDPTWTLHYARCLLEKGRSKEAVSALGLLSPKDADALFQAGVMLGRGNAPAEAAAFFARARGGYRDPYAAGYNQVLMLTRSGQAEEAIRVGEALLAEGSRPTELYRLMSEAYLKRGQVKEAYDALRTATRLEPQAEELYLDLAAICLDHDSYDLGLEIVDVGLTHRPDSLALRLQRGVMLAMKSQLAQAEGEFDRAREMAPQAAAPYVALAMAWMQTGRTEKAVEVLRERSGTGTKNAVIPYMLAVALLRSGADPAGSAGEEAVAALEASVRLDPRFPGSRAELGKLLLKRGAVEPAIRQLERAVALDPQSPAPAYALAQAYFKTGAKDRAEKLMAQVSRFNARQREGDPDAELRRVVVRIVREGAALPASRPPTP